MLVLIPIFSVLYILRVYFECICSTFEKKKKCEFYYKFKHFQGILLLI